LRFCVAIAVFTLIAYCSPSRVQAADPQPIGTASGDCSGGGFASSYSLPPTPDNHFSTIQMAHVSKAGFWASRDIELAGPDTVWKRGGRLQAGIAETGYFDCLNNTALTYTVTQYDTPNAPSSYSGSITPGEGGFDAVGSDLAYIAPGAAPYVADVTLAQGAIRVGDSGVVVASAKTVDLGATSAGEHVLRLTALDGPQAVWRVTIRPLPIQVTGLVAVLASARPGDANTIRYTTNGDTRITATVTDSAGAPVRTLATTVPVVRGDHTLTWDGTDQNGRVLKDGAYTIDLHSIDPIGNQSDAQARVAIDGTPPRIVWARSSKLGPKQAIIVRVSDAGVGVRSAVMKYRGRTVARLRAGSLRIVYRPRRGYRWAPGRVRYTVTARDALGNGITRSRTLRVRR
jgi:FlgD Ig-like domain